MQVSDVDGTMIEDNGHTCATACAFRDYWESTATLCSSIMVYNTGRSIGQLTGLLESRSDCMVVPDAIITAVGTKVFLLNQRKTRSTARGDSWCAPQSSRTPHLRLAAICLPQRCACIRQHAQHGFVPCWRSRNCTCAPQQDVCVDGT